VAEDVEQMHRKIWNKSTVVHKIGHLYSDEKSKKSLKYQKKVSLCGGGKCTMR
jgi:hypothetical protein